MATIKSIKEKAKAYDEAIEKAKNCLKDGTITNTAISYIETIFPELKKCEDEKIRACIRMCLTDIDEQRFADFNTNLKECRDWLKKKVSKNHKVNQHLKSLLIKLSHLANIKDLLILKEVLLIYVLVG